MKLQHRLLYLMPRLAKLCALMLMLGGMAPRGVQGAPPLEAGKPIRVGNAEGVGPLALPVIGNAPRGYARVTGAAEPDLFVHGTAGPNKGLYLYPFKRRSADGSPVFGVPQKVKGSFADNGTILQLPDKQVHAVWVQGDDLLDAVYDAQQKAFVDAGKLTLAGLPNKPAGVTILPNADGSAEALLEMIERVVPAQDRMDARLADYQPFDGRGVWRGGFAYAGMYALPLAGVLKGPQGAARPATATTREVRMQYMQATVVNLGAGHERDIVCGSRFGEFSYYGNKAAKGVELAKKKLIARQDGNTLRHPIINAQPIAYPNPKTGLSDLLAGGEGSIYSYSFSGKWTQDGRPIFNDPTPVMQEPTDLYGGSLAIANVVDWNGDGAQDIVCGNSDGGVLFFKNTGTSAAPAFQIGEAVCMGDGRPIFVQPGYSQDIQGPGEARWGYTGPNVVDWNEDGVLDIIMSDSTAKHTVYMNRGTAQAPKLDAPKGIYCDGLDLHGMWRIKPGVGKMGERMAYVLLDDAGEFHLYWRLDDYNVEDAGKLKMENGAFIGSTGLDSGGSGRVKINLFDWDGDGKVDIIAGTSKPNAIPDKKGWPFGQMPRPVAVVLFIKNVGTNEAPVYKTPVPFRFHGEPVTPGGAHECGPCVAAIGPMSGGPNLISGNEQGRFIFYPRNELTWE